MEVVWVSCCTCRVLRELTVQRIQLRKFPESQRRTTPIFVHIPLGDLADTAAHNQPVSSVADDGPAACRPLVCPEVDRCGCRGHRC